MATSQTSSQLVNSLPLRLRNFFARYPPQIYSAAVRPKKKTPPLPAAAAATATSTAPTTSESTTAAPAPAPTQDQQTPQPTTLSPDSLPSPYISDRTAPKPPKPDPLSLPSRSLLHSTREHPNPFLPIKRGKKWQGPRYGLRQQADLVKLAIRYKVEELLPPGKKSTEYKEMRRAERGLAIKGTGIGEKVKGHKWERTMESRLEERRKAIMEMPEMINLWKQVSFLVLELGCVGWGLANCLRAERSWAWVEEVAQEVRTGLAGISQSPSIHGFLVQLVDCIVCKIVYLGHIRLVFIDCKAIYHSSFMYIISTRHIQQSINHTKEKPNPQP